MYTSIFLRVVELKDLFLPGIPLIILLIFLNYDPFWKKNAAEGGTKEAWSEAGNLGLVVFISALLGLYFIFSPLFKFFGCIVFGATECNAGGWFLTGLFLVILWIRGTIVRTFFTTPPLAPPPDLEKFYKDRNEKKRKRYKKKNS